MPGIDALLEKLETSQEKQTVEEHWEKKKQEWIQDLENLRRTISQWLQRGVDRGLLKLESRTITLDEPDLGTYDAPALDIQIQTKGGAHVVKVEPRSLRVVGVIPTPGVRIVGAVGRVDLICGPARAMLLRRSPGKWQFVAVDREFSSGSSVIDLSEDSLAEVLAELID